MSRKRFLAPWRREAAELEGLRTDAEIEGHLAGLRGKAAIYHCVSRIVDRRKVLGPAERELFVRYMREYEQFCMIRILTYCVMGNHFHILVEIPDPPEDRGKSWSDEKFLGHISCRYRDEEYQAIASELKYLRREKRDQDAEALRDRFFVRMWDLSKFMHDLKLRFAQWFNRCKEREGTLWSTKFRSVLVQSGHAARVVATYIDLNPVRAGMVEDPKDYRWCGYGEAVAGLKRAREGLRLIVFGEAAAHSGGELGAKEAGSWKDVAARYRRNLYMDGEESPRDEKKGRAGIRREKVAEVMERKGRLSEAELMRCRARHFTDGLVIGSESFVEGVFQMARGYFSPRRKSGARRIRGVDTPLHAMRDLRKNAVSSRAS